MLARIKLSNSSSPLTANCKCLGVILLTFKSLLALPANSKTSAVKYSKIAEEYTAAVAPILFCPLMKFFKNLWILPTGNYFLKNKKTQLEKNIITIDYKIPNKI